MCILTFPPHRTISIRTATTTKVLHYHHTSSRYTSRFESRNIKPTITSAMSSHEPFPSVVPMPYLTPLYKAHINDAASVRHHIFLPLRCIWQLAIEHIRRCDLNDPAARLLALPRVKEQFTILVSYSCASPDLKRALFELPLEDIFDKCFSSFCNFYRFENTN